MSDERSKKFCRLIQTLLLYQTWTDLDTAPRLCVTQLQQNHWSPAALLQYYEKRSLHGHEGCQISHADAHAEIL